MTEDATQKGMVEIGGVKCHSREAAERAIRLADPEEVVRLAFAGGAAVLELERGQVLGRCVISGWDTCGPREVLLWAVSDEDRFFFRDLLQREDNGGNWLEGDEVEEVLLRVREGMTSMRLDAECVPVDLLGEMVDAYNVRVGDRRAEEYARYLKDDHDGPTRCPHPMPTTDDLLDIARPHLDRVYGAKGKKTERTQG